MPATQCGICSQHHRPSSQNVAAGCWTNILASHPHHDTPTRSMSLILSATPQTTTQLLTIPKSIFKLHAVNCIRGR
jgi:hypothetical protein